MSWTVPCMWMKRVCGNYIRIWLCFNTDGWRVISSGFIASLQCDFCHKFVQSKNYSQNEFPKQNSKWCKLITFWFSRGSHMLWVNKILKDIAITSATSFHIYRRTQWTRLIDLFENISNWYTILLEVW